MNHPLLPGKPTRLLFPGYILYPFLVLLCTLLSLNVSAQCNAVITVVKNGNVVEDQQPDFCEGGNLTLTAWIKVGETRIEGKSWKWSTGETTRQITVTQDNKYTVEVEDNNGCKATAFVEVTKRFQAKKPVLMVDGQPVSGTKIICDGSDIRLTIDPQSDVTYEWEKDGKDIADAGGTNEYIAREAGIYAVRVSNSCGSVRSDPVEFKIASKLEKPVLTAEPSSAKICAGTGSSVKLSTKTIDGVKYVWKLNGQVMDGTEPVKFVDRAGNWTVEVVSETCNARETSNGIEVVVLAQVVPKAEDVKVCINNNATLKATGGSAGNYRWYTSNDLTEKPDPSRRDDTYVTQVLTQDATFYVAVFNGACEGPRVPIKVTVSRSKVTNKPFIKVNGPTKFCERGSVQMEVPLIDGITYRWKKDGVAFGTNSNVQVAKESGVYSVVLEDACGDIESDNRIIVNVIPFPDPPKVADVYSCTPSAFTLKASGGADGEFRWYNSQSNPTPFPGEDKSTYTTTYLEATSTTFYVSIMRDGCESPRVPIKAIISGPPVADAGPDAVINPGESTTLQGSGDGSYEWTPSDGLSNPNIANPIARPTKTTVYTLRVSRGANCVGQDEVTVIVREPMDIPNAFSPNGDGTNDTWEIENINTFPDARIEVFNRWGSKVYDKVGYQNDWNGMYRGSPLPVGVYFYVITLNGGYKMTGSVSIVH